VVPNFKVMEIDIDDVIWKDDIVTVPPVIENGDLCAEGRAGSRRQRGIRPHPPEKEIVRGKNLNAEEAEVTRGAKQLSRHASFAFPLPSASKLFRGQEA
jgi:hypothetical protein